MNEYTGDDNCFVFNLDNCINDKSQPMVIRQLFSEIKQYGYVCTGDFFRDMHASDLDVLREMVQKIEIHKGETPESMNAIESLTLFGMGLTFGEGMVLDEEVAQQAFQAVTVFISVEYLDRMKLVKAVRENWTMDPTANKEIARKI